MAEFEAYVRDRTYAMLSDIDDWLAALARRPIKHPEARIPTGVSVFQYVAPGDAVVDLDRHVIREDSKT
jgi:hypothetical protein